MNVKQMKIVQVLNHIVKAVKVRMYANGNKWTVLNTTHYGFILLLDLYSHLSVALPF